MGIVLCLRIIYSMIFSRSALLLGRLYLNRATCSIFWCLPKGEAFISVLPWLSGWSSNIVADTEGPSASISYHRVLCHSFLFTLLTTVADTRLRWSPRCPSPASMMRLSLFWLLSRKLPLSQMKREILLLVLKKQTAVWWRGPHGRGWQGAVRGWEQLSADSR